MPISDPARRVMADQGVRLPCDQWFRRFYTVYSDICTEGVATREDRDRAAKQNEAVVDNHFFNERGGLKAELLAAGVMYPETGKIDPHRFGWLDEVPNFVDYNTEKGGGRKKRGCRAGKKPTINSPENRDTLTIMAIQLVIGFLFGPQLVVARKYGHADMVPESDVYRYDAARFSNEIRLDSQHSHPRGAAPARARPRLSAVSGWRAVAVTRRKNPSAARVGPRRHGFMGSGGIGQALSQRPRDHGPST